MTNKRKRLNKARRRATGRRLRAAMDAAGQTYQKLAEATGLSAACLQSWVSGKASPTSELLALVAVELGVSADWILGLPPIPRKEGRANSWSRG